MKDIRDPMLSYLPAPIQDLPPCFQFATIVPKNLFITQQSLHIIQNTLITIWQTHIEQWYGESDTPQPQPTITPAAPATESQPIIKPGSCSKTHSFRRHLLLPLRPFYQTSEAPKTQNFE